jgi:endonuclease/exonuclease/phosphatase family metal-dependent hydrolase
MPAEPSVTAEPITPESTLRIATFNVLHGVSLRDGGCRPEDLRQAAILLDADIVGLQEVDRQQPRSGGVDQTALIAEALGAAHFRFAPALHGTPDGSRSWRPATDTDDAASPNQITGPTYGVGLVSRLPVLAWRVRRFAASPLRLPLPVPNRRLPMPVPDEPRVALAGIIDGPVGPFTVATTHLSFIPGWNGWQLRALTRWLSQLPAPRLLVGDFNLPGALPRILTGWTQLARAATYPAIGARAQLDHLLADGLAATAVRDVESITLPVSDHCALAVDLLPAALTSMQ